MNKESELEADARHDVSLLTIQAVAEAIQDVGKIPADKLYVQLRDTLKLHEYQQVIGALKRIGLVTETPGHLLSWNGPQIRKTGKPMNIVLSRIPEHALETVRIIAAVEGATLNTPEDYERFIRENEDALEVVLPYVDL